MAENQNLGSTTTGMQAELAAMLSYLVGPITGIIFYLIEKENKYVRFHAMQSIVAFGFLWIFLPVIYFVLAMIPVLGWAVASLLWLGSIILWIVCMIKAYQGEYLKLPVAGDIAEKNS